MNHHVQRYKEHVADGLSLEVAFTAVASAIPLSGTMDDLKMLIQAYDADSDKRSEKIFKKSEELNNEQPTRTISAV